MLAERRIALISAAQALPSSGNDPNSELVHQPAYGALALVCSSECDVLGRLVDTVEPGAT